MASQWTRPDEQVRIKRAAPHETIRPLRPVDEVDPEAKQDEVGRALSSQEQSCKLSEQPFPLRLALAGKHHLVDRMAGRSEVYITLRSLQRMVLHDLQHQISELVAKIHNTNNASRRRMDEAKDLMAAYGEPFHLLGEELDSGLRAFITDNLWPASVNVVKDYDYMVEKSNEAKELHIVDPFKITSKQKLGSYLLKKMGVQPSNFKMSNNPTYDQEKARWVNALPGKSSKEITRMSNKALIFERLTTGMTGGVAITAPVLVMVLKRDLLTRLLTLAFSVLSFTFVLAVAATKMRGETVVGLVAAYVAILVVFIGVS